MIQQSVFDANLLFPTGFRTQQQQQQWSKNSTNKSSRPDRMEQNRIFEILMTQTHLDSIGM